MTGFVYAISDGEGRVKIGWSADPLRRLNKINSDCPGNAQLLGVIEATKEQETEAHELFAPWLVSGEWFRLEGPVRSFVEMLPPPKPKPVEIDPNLHPLRKYLLRNRMTAVAFARITGLSEPTISLLCRNEFWPSRETAMAIYKATKGEITPTDFLHREAAA